MSKPKDSFANCSEKFIEILSSRYLPKKYTHEEYLMCIKKCKKTPSYNDSKVDKKY